MQQTYKHINFRSDALALLDVIHVIVEDYTAQGYRLTVRQLYYQLVARDVIANTERSYKRITGLVNDGRLAGLIDWDAIEDRTRSFITRPRWHSGAEILDSAAAGFHMDMWANQPSRVFCIVEKEALAGVLERACRKYDVPLLAARGYPSSTVVREFCQTLLELPYEQEIHILHLGDHDPSGIDMTRDLRDRIDLFMEGRRTSLMRIALTMDQVSAENPPPNPAKITDSRFSSYMRRYGRSSWELDALSPEYLSNLVGAHISEHVDEEAWEKRLASIEAVKKKLKKLSKDF